MKRRSNITLKCLMAAIGALFLGTALDAQAAMVLTLDDLSTVGIDKTITDTSGLDLNPTTGAITFVGSVGTFIIDVTTGLSKPVIGPGKLELTSVNVSGWNAGQLEIKLTDTDFSILTPGVLTSQIGGVAANKIEAWQYVDFSNREFAGPGAGPGIFSAHHGEFGLGAFSDTKMVGLEGYTGTFSLTERVLITHNAAFQATGLNIVSQVKAVPEASASLFLGISLIGLFGSMGISKAFKRRRVA